MTMDRARRDLLNLWVSDFLFGFKPEESAKAEAMKLYGLLAFSESRDGKQRPDWRGTSKIEPGQIFKIGEQYATRWRVPITFAALTAMSISATDANQMQMMMAVVYRRWIQLNRPFDKIDTLTVSMIFHEGKVSQEYFQEMWEKQKIQPGRLGGMTHRNLLDYIQAEDFLQTSDSLV